MSALTSYFKHVRDEFAHIVWPTRHTAIAHTLVVIFIAVVITVLVSVFDYVFTAFVSRVAGG